MTYSERSLKRVHRRMSRQFVTALHGMQARSRDENSVCQTRELCDKTEKKHQSRFLYHTKDHLA